MASYDLITEPWIPVRFTDGSMGTVGLRDALLRADAITEIATDSPVETIALYRLLLALSIRIFPETEGGEAWFEQWEAKRFEPDPINAYFEQWNDRFDLLHPVRPFYQVREKVAQSEWRIGKLRMDEGKDVPELFSHGDLKEDASFRLDAAARGVIGTQFASVGGLLANPFKTGNRATPFISGAVFWLRGDFLFQAMLLNAPPTARMGGGNADDKPAWEQDDPILTERRPVRGLLDYLTFQHRRITLEVSEPVDGGIVGRRVRITGGDSEDPMPLNDPHMCIISDEKKGKRPFNQSSRRALWRDSALLFTTLSTTTSLPANIVWLSANRQELGADRYMVEVFSIRTVGAETGENNSNIVQWRREWMPIFSRLLYDNERATLLKSALNQAEDQSKILWVACDTTARRLLFGSRMDSKLSPDDRASAGKVARALDVDVRFWASLEQQFYPFLYALSTSDDLDDAIRKWATDIHRLALAAFDAATSSMVASGRQLRAVAEGRAELRASRSYQVTQTEPLTESEEIPHD